MGISINNRVLRLAVSAIIVTGGALTASAVVATGIAAADGGTSVFTPVPTPTPSPTMHTDGDGTPWG